MICYLKYTKGNKYFQRHWVVNTVWACAKASGAFDNIDTGDLRGNSRVKEYKRLRRINLWNYVQSFIDDCMEEFGIRCVVVDSNCVAYSYYIEKGAVRGHWGKKVTDSHVELPGFIPHEEMVWKLIKTIFATHYNAKSNEAILNKNQQL